MALPTFKWSIKLRGPFARYTRYTLLKLSQIIERVVFGNGCASKKVTFALVQTTIAILMQSSPGCVSASWRLLCPALGLLLVYCLPKHSNHSNHSVRAFLHIASIGTTSAPWTPLATDPPSRHSIQPCLIQSYCQSSFSFKDSQKILSLCVYCV